MNEYVKELVRLGHICTVKGSDVDKIMQQFVEMGIAKKAWFRNKYTPTDAAREVAKMIRIDELLTASYKSSR
jgi:hypothetical protein